MAPFPSGLRTRSHVRRLAGTPNAKLLFRKVESQTSRHFSWSSANRRTRRTASSFVRHRHYGLRCFCLLLLEVDGDSILVIAETRSGYPIGNAEIVQHVSNCFRGVRTTRNRGARLSGGVIVAAKVAPPKSALVIAAAISADCRY